MSVITVSSMLVAKGLSKEYLPKGSFGTQAGGVNTMMECVSPTVLSTIVDFGHTIAKR